MQRSETWREGEFQMHPEILGPQQHDHYCLLRKPPHLEQGADHAKLRGLLLTLVPKRVPVAADRWGIKLAGFSIAKN